MAAPEREAVEQAIERVLLEQWDPLGIHETASSRDAYHKYVHDLYSLLARGGSDVQVARQLHRIEHEDLGGPDVPTRDVTATVRALRAIERRM